MKTTRRICSLLSLALTMPLVLDGCASVETGFEAGPPDLAPRPRHGFIRLGSSSVSSGVDTYEQSMAMALFFDPYAANPVCTRKESGACVTYRCGPIKNVPSAGDISIKGGREDVLLSPGPDGAYTEYRNTSAITFARGQILMLSATGKDVPAWQMPLTIPTQVFTL